MVAQAMTQPLPIEGIEIGRITQGTRQEIPMTENEAKLIVLARRLILVAPDERERDPEFLGLNTNGRWTVGEYIALETAYPGIL